MKKHSAIIELKRSIFSFSMVLEGMHYRIVKVMVNRSAKILVSKGNVVFSSLLWVKLVEEWKKPDRFSLRAIFWGFGEGCPVKVRVINRRWSLLDRLWFIRSVSSRGFHSVFVPSSDTCRYHSGLEPETFTFLFSVIFCVQKDRAPAWVKTIMQEILPYELGRYRRHTLPKK